MLRLVLFVCCFFIVLSSSSIKSRSVYVNDSVLDGQTRTLTWLPSVEGGLFSHFFQVRYINLIAKKFNRTLVIAPHTSKHATDDIDVIMCDVLQLEGMECVSKPTPSNKKCLGSLDLEAVHNVTHVCFNGHNIWGRISLFEVMKLGPSLIFRNHYVQLYEQVKYSFMSQLANTSDDWQFMAVHWRRGDQLATRCLPDWKGYKDQSVNCKSPEAFTKEVKQFVGGYGNVSLMYNVSTILVGTNEQNETSLAHLRAEGLTLMSDIIARHYISAGDHPANLTSLEAFIVEAQFMLHAPLLLSFGISQINDVLESERAKMDLPHCLHAELVDHKSWCEGMRNGRHLPKEQQRPMSPPHYQPQQHSKAANHTSLGSVVNKEGKHERR